MSEKLISNITQLTYEVNSYNFMLNDDGVRTVYDIYRNGHISSTVYNGEEETEDGVNRILPVDQVTALYTAICDLLQNAEHVHHYIDDKTATLTIHLNGGDITLPRGLSTDSISLNQIMSEFIKQSF